jgi:hypothetical protein
MFACNFRNTRPDKESDRDTAAGGAGRHHACGACSKFAHHELPGQPDGKPIGPRLSVGLYEQGTRLHVENRSPTSEEDTVYAMPCHSDSDHVRRVTGS